MSFLIVRDDLSVVEAEFIRPRAWIESLGLVKEARLDLAVPELEIDGLAEVTAVRDCPPIAEGEGRVVTGRFVTREAVNVVTVTLANGTEIRATDVHPVWSVDREEWVPAGKLEPGEQVDTLEGPVAVVSVERLESRIKQHRFCKSRGSEVGHQASMGREARSESQSSEISERTAEASRRSEAS